MPESIRGEQRLPEREKAENWIAESPRQLAMIWRFTDGELYVTMTTFPSGVR
jgi:hypothetical protein